MGNQNGTPAEENWILRDRGRGGGGSRDGTGVKARASHQCGLGSVPALSHMWVEFVVGSRPCSESFSPGSPVFPSTQKPTLQFDQDRRPA